VLRTPRGRLVAILVVIACVYGVLGMRLIELQASEQQRYEQLGLDKRVQLVALPAESGGIFDRNGNEQAYSESR
jgi:cell division protein FtsI/penicillin-binding protein 2